MSQELLTQESSYVWPQEATESALFHQRRAIDPLEIAFASDEERRTIAEQSLEGWMVQIDEGNGHEAMEFAADYAYRSLGTALYADTASVAKEGERLALELLESDDTAHPARQLGIAMRLLDMSQLRMYANYLIGRDGRSLQTEKQARALYEAGSFDVIKKSVKLLGRFNAVHGDISDDESRQDLRGKQFELLYLTYARLHEYESDAAEPKVFLSATEFEDRSARQFRPANHGYDVLSMAPDGHTVDLIQCKNYRNATAYAPPIKKVMARAFYKFMNDADFYLDAMQIIASNRPDIPEAVLKVSRGNIERLFMIENTPGQTSSVGRGTLAAAGVR